MKIRKHLRLFVLLLAPLLGGACIAEMIGPIQTPQVVVVTNTGEPTRSDQQPPAPTAEGSLAPDLTPTPTVLSVTMTAGQDLSCVTGPDWKLYEWVTRIHDGETVTLVARAVPEIPDYYVAHTGDGKECWAFGGSSVLSGPVETLPVRETPPLPTVSFVVRNRVYVHLLEVYIRPAGDGTWGPDLLVSASIPTGGETAFSITAGYYDVRIGDAFSNVMYVAYNRAIGADDTYRILEVATDVEFTVRNDNPSSLCWLDVKPPDEPWEKLYDSTEGGGPILNGATRTFTLRAGIYGIQITLCSAAPLLTTGLYVYPEMPLVAIP